MAKIKWLHISDLHLNRAGVETTRLRELLPQYLKNLDIRCDYVFCSGDIRYAPMGDFSDDSMAMIEILCDAVNVPLNRFFITPGNHDVNCNADGRDLAIKNIWVTNDDQHKGYYYPKEGVINSSDLDHIMKGTQSYKFTLQKVFSAHSDSHENQIKDFGPHRLVETNDFNIVILDSTVTYTKSQERNLIVGTGYLQETLKACNNEKPTIILTHYSFDYIDRSEQDIIFALFRDYNVRLWFAGHEHNNLFRKQRDYFYEFQCGNLLLENDAMSCILIGELDTQTLTGQIQVHAWFSPDGWAVYPFACPDSNKYSFNIARRNSDMESQVIVSRLKLRNQIIPILLENKSIYETYGPTSNNRNVISSELPTVWKKMIQEKILPNSLQIIELLKTQQFLLSESEINILGKYQMHIYGLKENHSRVGSFKLDAPLFPTEIFSILE